MKVTVCGEERYMPNYELIFESRFEELISSVPSAMVRRVIYTNNYYWVRKIAEAMIGEEVQIHEYLTRLMEIRPTVQQPKPISFAPNSSWQRVTAKLTTQKLNYCYQDQIIIGLEITT